MDMHHPAQAFFGPGILAVYVFGRSKHMVVIEYKVTKNNPYYSDEYA